MCTKRLLLPFRKIGAVVEIAALLRIGVPHMELLLSELDVPE